ncbi:hypothetical protein NLI96_g6388 [Meripilus lineatus]|uniref:Cytochrome b-c1 complex subunit 10 n=1 Tax=Meripilus lineatus TaxID=2056292 RepID=A0AAD5V2T2_9APHY|nr:hypothetical protein NLI96_g6388 [Physisporinus lineatus]
MSRVSYHPTPAFKLSTDFSRRWGTTLGVWGVGAGIAALFVLSVTPLVKREFLTKVPVLGNHYEDKIPASDKPF